MSKGPSATNQPSLSTMAAYNAHPPHRHHSTERITPSHALSLLSSYLAAASTDPSLHPNALLTEGGPTTPASGAQNIGLVLHNLKRVEAGLSGQQLGADLTLEKYGGEGLPDLMFTENCFQDLLPEVSGQPLGDGNGAGEGWQDKMEFERQQEVVQGEMGERDNAGGQGRDALRVPRVEATKTTADKEDRKKRKKRRRQQERREEEAKKQREKDTEG